MKSLTNKSLSQYLISTVVILLLATPLFYLLTKNYYAEEMADLLKAVRLGKPIPASDLEEDIVTGLMIQYLLVFMVLSFAFVFMMRFATRRLWNPFYDTLRKVEHFNLNQDRLPEFTKTRIKEFARLNEAVSSLINKDQTCYRREKEFTENASHELQTPIAIIQGKLDMLLQEKLTERQAHIVSELYEVNSRMSKVNKNMLLLAKIENNQYQDTERIDVVDFINQRLSLYKDLQNGTCIHFVSPTIHPALYSNKGLFESLFYNLIVNALRHTSIHASIDILLMPTSLTISNASSGKGPLDSERLFSRFHHTDDLNRGNGLGLSIVKSICDFHGWVVDYSYEDNKHCFTVKFGRSIALSQSE